MAKSHLKLKVNKSKTLRPSIKLKHCYIVCLKLKPKDY